ncbi:hypothetical protein [Scytonema sp. PRP1]|uniref:hypothetical protein n=1 Tax=Scytonema sp. PRP1 TaxID=3120513 RepID=UPI00300C55ED
MLPTADFVGNQPLWEWSILFMGDGSPNKWQLTQGNDESRHAIVGVLNAVPKLEQRSGRYRQQNAVPISKQKT